MSGMINRSGTVHDSEPATEFLMSRATRATIPHADDYAAAQQRVRRCAQLIGPGGNRSVGVVGFEIHRLISVVERDFMNPSFSQDPTQRPSFSHCPRTRHFPAITFNARETLDNDGTVCSTIHSQSRIGKNIRRGLRKLRTDAEGRSQ